jgi:hypothetical protein
MTPFLTVKEAAQRTGKSPSSIRRVIYPIIQNDQHPDRPQIEPSVEEALRQRMKGESFAWRLSDELLRRKIPLEAGTEPGAAGASTRPSSGQGDGELLTMLRRELEIKNQQITVHGELIGKQMELISGLSERLREGNILIASLQQRLALTDGREAKTIEPMKAKTAAPAKPEKGSPTPAKAPKPKRGFFARIFRKSA